MKVCPKCNVNYADDTLSFCLDDGTLLAAARETDMPTVILEDTEVLTSVRPSGISTDPRFMDSQVTSVGKFVPPQQQPKTSNTALAVILTALGMVLLFGVVGVAGYFYFLNKDRPVITNAETNMNGNTPNAFNANSSPTATPAPSPTPTAMDTNFPTPTINPTPPVIDEPAIKSEVSKQVYGWKSALESRNLSGYMSNYADTVDYYTKSGVSFGTVKADKARAFAIYNSMQVNVSNMTVTAGPDGQTATAVFDKEWTFSGNSISSGKVRSQLKYRKFDRRWLITSERDLKVYYTR
ncbi:MAG: hypothetical protein KA956_12555 [Pyrinomonadaceae bacterium]|nr:hypothetical protein [Acidobacteriota bacterium]MBP7377298.1 hypothetical protein [Pyrinomonadaceae bacterium]